MESMILIVVYIYMSVSKREDSNIKELYITSLLILAEYRLQSAILKTMLDLKPFMCFTNSSSIPLATPTMPVFTKKTKDPLVEEKQWSTCRYIHIFTTYLSNYSENGCIYREKAFTRWPLRRLVSELMVLVILQYEEYLWRLQPPSLSFLNQYSKIIT